MDKIVDKIAALGVPGLVLVVVMAATGWAGGAAVTTALAALGGPLGMLGGIGLLIILALISNGLTQYGFEAIFKATVERLRDNGIEKEEILKKVDGYPISRSMKSRIREHIQRLA